MEQSMGREGAGLEGCWRTRESLGAQVEGELGVASSGPPRRGCRCRRRRRRRRRKSSSSSQASRQASKLSSASPSPQPLRSAVTDSHCQLCALLCFTQPAAPMLRCAASTGPSAYCRAGRAEPAAVLAFGMLGRDGRAFRITGHDGPSGVGAADCHSPSPPPPPPPPPPPRRPRPLLLPLLLP